MQEVKKGISVEIMDIIITGIVLIIVLIFTSNITLANEGDTWVTPVSEDQTASQNFDVKIYVDTDTKHVNSFNMYLDFDPTYITVDTSQGENPGADDGKGFHKGADTQNYTMGSNSNDIANGHFRFAGIKGTGGTVGSNQHIITIHLQTTAAFTSGTTNLTVRVNEMSETSEGDIAVGTKTGSTITYQAGTAPTVTEITPITTPSNDTTPSYTFSYTNNTGLGTADWGGSCDGYFAETADAVGNGNNTTTATVMPEGDYNDCTLTVTDAGTSASTTIFVASFTIDTTAPTVAEVTPVTTPTNDTTPDYTFSSTEAGTIIYGGDCSSATTAAVSGNNTVTLNALSVGIHSNCTITVTDSAGNVSSVLNVTSFEITTPPTCTSFTYSDWGACQSNSKQTRTVTSSTPSGCTGGSPVVEQGCTYDSGSGMDVNKFTPKVKIKHSHKKYKLRKKKTLYLRKRKLSFQSKDEELIGGRVQLFIDGKLKDEVVVDANGKWKLGKKLKKSGRYKIRFKYFNGDGGFLGESHKYKIKIDTRKPRFIDLPSFLTKRVGDRVHFQATDSKKSKKVQKKVKYYKYYFLGKKHKTKKPEFIIPAGTSRGLHTLKVRAYDKAGNKVTKIVVIRVR